MKLTYEFNCLDGDYKLIVEDDLFVVESTIECFESRQGKVDINEFNKYLLLAKIEAWDKEYLGEEIEDGIKWSVNYNGHISRGLETYEPYGYEYLIKAISLIEENADYFKA